MSLLLVVASLTVTECSHILKLLKLKEKKKIFIVSPVKGVVKRSASGYLEKGWCTCKYVSIAWSYRPWPIIYPYCIGVLIDFNIRLGLDLFIFCFCLLVFWVVIFISSLSSLAVQSLIILVSNVAFSLSLSLWKAKSWYLSCLCSQGRNVMEDCYSW